MDNWTVADVTGHAGVTGRYLTNLSERLFKVSTIMLWRNVIIITYMVSF